MKLTKRHLRRIIREELQLLREQSRDPRDSQTMTGFDNFGPEAEAEDEDDMLQRARERVRVATAKGNAAKVSVAVGSRKKKKKGGLAAPLAERAPAETVTVDASR